jgi:hypothetical protein
LKTLSDEFLKWFYYGHRKILLELVERQVDVNKIFLGLTRNNPCVITYSPEDYPNGAIKSVGFLPKEEYIQPAIRAYREFVEKRWEKIKAQNPPGYEGVGWRMASPRPLQIEGWRLALEHMYLEPEEARKRIDFTKLSTLEGFYGHTWENIKRNRKACLLYYLPPAMSFEIRCNVEIQEKGPYHEFTNLSACLTHGENPEKWVIKPAYIFNVESVFDNSITPERLSKFKHI